MTLSVTTHVSSALFTGLLVVLAGARACADETGRPPGASPDAVTTGNAPQSLEEGLRRLEETLGRFNPDDQVEWRIPTDSELRSRPNAAEPEVLQVFEGLKVIGHPFRESASIAFDEISQWERRIYDIGPQDERTLTRTQVSHNVTRVFLKTSSGIWFVNTTMLSNGVHAAVNHSTFQGVVKWHDDGFELIGTTGVDRSYAAGGKYILSTAHGRVRYMRNADVLIVKTSSQTYELAMDPSGQLLQFPDFSKPIGSPFVKEVRSGPREQPGGHLSPPTQPVRMSELDGTWTVIKSLEGGEWTDEAKEAFIVVREDGLQTITKGGKPFSRRRFHSDLKPMPKQVTFDDAEDAEKKTGRTLGIYELDGGALKVAILSDPTKRSSERPEDFKEDGTKWIYMYRRVDP